MGAMYAPMVQGPADLYRFVAPMFLHMDLMHLLFNMVALYSVGELLERVLGRGNFLLLYFVAGITGNVVSYAVDMAQGGGLSVSAGASTSVFGLFVAVALLCVLVRGNRAVFRDFSKSMLSIIAVNVIYTLLVPNISIQRPPRWCHRRRDCNAAASCGEPSHPASGPHRRGRAVGGGRRCRPRLGRRFLESNRRECGVLC